MKKDEKCEQMRKFLQSCVDRELAFEGEDAIEMWSEKYEENDGDDETLKFDMYKLSDTDKQTIREICHEFYAAREQEEADREKRRLAEEEADRVVANHYADRIRHIVLKGMDKRWLPQIKEKSSPRGKGH